MTDNVPAQLCSAEAAIAGIQPESTVACSGFIGAGHPEQLTLELERRFLHTGMPANLTLVYAAGPHVPTSATEYTQSRLSSFFSTVKYRNMCRQRFLNTSDRKSTRLNSSH